MGEGPREFKTCRAGKIQILCVADCGIKGQWHSGHRDAGEQVCHSGTVSSLRECGGWTIKECKSEREYKGCRQVKKKHEWQIL